MRRISTDDIELSNKSVRYGPSFSVGNKDAFAGYIDAWNKQPAPTSGNLLKAYSRLAYTCANRNADGVTNGRLRLYTYNPKASKQRLKTLKLDFLTKTHLRKTNKRFKAVYAQQSQVEEVIDHDFLSLWENPNPEHTASDFLGYWQVYQEVIGTTFIKFVPNKLGRLQEWWVLPSQCVRPKKDADKRVIGFDYCGEILPTKATRESDVDPYVVAIPRRNPNDPYGAVGLSPLAASFESINLDAKMMATMAAILDNEGRPSGILSPAEPIGAAEAKRWETRFNLKFRQAGSGGLMVSEEDVNFTPLTFPPKDLAALEVSKATKGEIILAFDQSPALFETQQYNRSTLDASTLLWVRQGLWPRLRIIEEFINKNVLPMYGDNLFVAFDDPSPESEETTGAYLKNLVGAPIMTPNEGRMELDLPPLPEGDNLIGMPGQEIGSGPTDQPQDQPAEATGQAPTDNVQATALNGAQIDSLVNLALSLASKELPPETVRALIAASFPTLSAQQIADIVNPLLNFEAAVPEPAPAPNPMTPVADPTPADQPEGKAFKGRRQQWQEPPVDPHLEEVAAKFFEKYRRSALAQIKKDFSGSVVRKAFQPLDSARDELAEDARPFIEILLDEGGKELLQRVGVDPDVFSVTNPETAKAVDRAAFEFADSTNQSTTMALNDALAKLRETLSDSLSEGDRLHEMTKRVNEIFDGLTEHRAKLIAQTESSRAHHEGMREAAKASGVVKGFEILISPDACPVCQGLKGKRIKLDGYFVEGEGTYGNRIVPIHPGCRCAMTEVLDFELGERWTD